MLRYLRLEYRLAVQHWTWIVLLLSIALRIVGVVGPSSGWLSFFAIAFPLIISVPAMHLLDQERRWRTKPVLIAARCGALGVLALRFVMLAIPLLALPFVILPPLPALSVLAPAALLASVALTVGVRLGSEFGAGLGLAWWSLSFLAFITAASENHVVFTWLSVIASPQAAQDEQTIVLVAKLGVTAALLVSPIVGGLISGARKLAHRD